MKKKQKSWGTYTELTNEEAVRKYGRSIAIVGGAPAAPRRKSLKEFYRNAGSALTVQFDGEEQRRTGGVEKET